ncbi:hypothetical protein [Pseudaestuariivita sp.]|uniref:hypothetical protein n=1 Tax=Pseudaestuariivita sp. TaxID=2211669 RepID=UPI0040598949
MPEATPHDMPEVTPAARARRRALPRALLWLLCVAFVGGVAAAGFALTLPGRSFVAPAWIEARVEARLQELLPQTDVRVARMRVAFERNLSPRIGLEDVELADTSGFTRLSLTDLDVGVSLAAATEGAVRARDLRVSGVVIAAARARDGSLNFAFGQSGAARQFDSLGDALAAVSAVFDDPRLGALREVQLDGVTLRYDDARAGRNWTVDGGRVALQRQGTRVALSGDFAVLGGRSVAASLGTSLTTDLETGETAFTLNVRDVAARDLASQAPALAWLEVLRASISGSLSGGFDADGALQPLRAALQLSNGALQPTDATDPVPFRLARTTLTYDPGTDVIAISQLDIDSAWAALGATGQVLLGARRNGLPEDFTAQLRFGRIVANPAGLYEEAQVIAGADLDFKIALDPFELTIGQARLRSGEMPITARGRVAAGQAGWLWGVEAAAPSLSWETVARHWPEALYPNTRRWLSANLEAAALRGVQFALRRTGPAREDRDFLLSFGFDGAEVGVVRGLPPVTGAAGQFTLERGRLAITTVSGGVDAPQGGRVELGGSTFVIPDVRQKPSRGEVALRGEGPVTAILSLLDQEPFGYITKAGQQVTLAKSGTARFDGQIALPVGTRPGPGEVAFAFDAVARDVASDVLVKGRSLTARRLDIRVDNGGLRVAGAVDLSGVPFDGAFEQPFAQGGAPGKVTGEVTVSDAALRSFGVRLPQGYVSGSGPADVEITLARGQAPTFDVRSRLSGIGLRLDPIGWRLGRETRGTLSVSGALTQPTRIDRIALDAPGLEAEGRITLTRAGAFESLRLDRIVAGGWLDARGRLRSRGAGRTPAVEITGGRLDMRKAPFRGRTGAGQAGGAGATTPVTASLDRLTVTDGIFLAPLRAELTVGPQIEGRFSGNVGGAAPLSGLLEPSRGSTGVTVESPDAGRVLAAAGLMKRGGGGQMNLRLRPVRDRTGHYDGDLNIKNIRLRDAPAVAALLSAISVVGILEQMGGEGILFSDVEAEFRLAPDRVTLLNSSAVGPSMGISMDGFYKFADQKIDVRGVISPIYILNALGSIFSRNREGLFGFAYGIKGTTSAPNVRVNPMSLLTPGMFRDLFRKPPPTVD